MPAAADGSRYRRESIARQVLAAAFHNSNVIFDTDSAEGPEPVYALVVHHFFSRRSFEIFQQHVYDVYAGFYG